MGKTSSAVHNRYIAKAYDRINLTVYKGQKEIIKSAADAVGLSVNAYINRAIAEQLKKDNIEYSIEDGEQ